MIAMLDKTDVHILKKLLEDGRTSYKVIADEIKLSDTAVRKRVEALRRRGIIEAIRAEINYDALGFEKPLFVQLRTDISKTKEILKRLQNFDHIVEIYHVIGEYNLLLKAVLPNIEALKEFIERIGCLDGVLDMKTLVVLDKVKKSVSLPTTIVQGRL